MTVTRTTRKSNRCIRTRYLPGKAKRKRNVKVVSMMEKPTRDWSKWVSATETRNYLINDPILDWLKMYSNNLAQKRPTVREIVKGCNIRTNSFTNFIMSQGCSFEENLIGLLYRIHGTQNFHDVGGGARNIKKAQETIDAMKKGIPIILSGVLHNEETQTYGIPDMIVRSDWLEKLVDEKPIVSSVAAPLLFSSYEDENQPKYHYRIIDIKFTTLYLRADGIHILNTGSFPAYKGQLYLYNQALGKIQGYTPDCAYLLGRKWRCQQAGTVYKGQSCLERLGVVDFSTIDNPYIDKTKKAVEWIRKVRLDGKNWNPYIVPNPVSELYPNMSNVHDYPYRSLKKHIAEYTKEISSLWMCGKKNRDIAHANGVYSWIDPNCNCDSLGINGQKIRTILSQILYINQGGKKVNDVLPKKISAEHANQLERDKVEFYIDFETVNDVITDFSQLPKVGCTGMIFLIGIGWLEDEKTWNFRKFCVEDLTLEEEERICSEFIDFIIQEMNQYEDNTDYVMYHWGHAERTCWNEMLTRQYDDLPTSTPPFFDLLSIFKSEPITIKGCLGFGLKEVATSLKRLGKIKDGWDEDNGCENGTDAIMGCIEAKKLANMRRVGMTDIPVMQDIIQYNEIDCKVLMQIVEFIRTELF